MTSLGDQMMSLSFMTSHLYVWAQQCNTGLTAKSRFLSFFQKWKNETEIYLELEMAMTKLTILEKSRFKIW